MIGTALNVGTLAGPIGPACHVCPDTNLGAVELCCGPKYRLGYIKSPSVDVVLQVYDKGDATAVECAGCGGEYPECSEPSTAELKVNFFLRDGNVYAHFRDGRRGQDGSFEAKVTLLGGNSVTVTASVRVRGPEHAH